MLENTPWPRLLHLERYGFYPVSTDCWVKSLKA